MRLLVGLGNPGSKYDRTRHNVGFRVAEEVARKLGIPLDQTKFSAVLGTGRAAGEHVAILLPQTFMNVSGESVGPAARFWKVPPGEVVVAHDDMDLDFGRVQVKVGGGDGGHNGLRSLRAHLGTPDFVRIRVGVGRPPQGWDPADYVLGKLSEEEEAELKAGALDTAAGAAQEALVAGAKLAMNRWNRRPKPAKPESDGEVKPSAGALKAK